ncbi:MAG TPA: hypothetical protein VGD77_13430 [Gemmatimonadaceae bacterium]
MTAPALVARHRRAIGVIALLIVALGAWKGVALTAADREARSPLPVGTALPASLGALLQDATSPDRAAVVMYVSESCPHCAAEVARWDSLDNAGRLPRSLRRLLIVAPASDGRRHQASFPDLTLLDRDHRLAATLRVRMVPITYWVDARGTIRRVTQGEQLPWAIINQAHSLVGGLE